MINVEEALKSHLSNNNIREGWLDSSFKLGFLDAQGENSDSLIRGTGAYCQGWNAYVRAKQEEIKEKSTKCVVYTVEVSSPRFKGSVYKLSELTIVGDTNVEVLYGHILKHAEDKAIKSFKEEGMTVYREELAVIFLMFNLMDYKV